MSARPVTHYVAVCGGCGVVADGCAASEEAAESAACRSQSWTDADGVLCPECQPCTECSHGGGPEPAGRLCAACRATVCGGCGHPRSGHLFFPDAALYDMPLRACYLDTGQYTECDCPFIAREVQP